MAILPLFLSDVAGSEILIIVVVVLFFFGSKSVPGIAKTLGQALYQVRNASNELQQEIRKSGEAMKSELNVSELLKETEEAIQEPLDQLYTDIDNTVHYNPMPRHLQQQVTAGNPVEDEAPTQTEPTPASSQSTTSQTPDA
ncbi:MAG: hypothetical protein RLZZ301_546 [Bacteroidota bacterium]|jgi:sec-independent protein translocase protein TatA